MTKFDVSDFKVSLERDYRWSGDRLVVSISVPFNKNDCWIGNSTKPSTMALLLEKLLSNRKKLSLIQKLDLLRALLIEMGFESPINPVKIQLVELREIGNSQNYAQLLPAQC